MFVKILIPFVKMKNVAKFVISLFFIGLFSTASAKTYYVAPTGGSDVYPGTITQPWATWQKAFNTAVAGDTVYFRGGVWYPATKVVKGYPITLINPPTGHGHSGTHDNPIVYMAYPPDFASGNYPILDCQYASQSTTGNIGVQVSNASYIYFKGLTIRNVRMLHPDHNVYGIVAQSNLGGEINFENITAHHIGGVGISGRDNDTIIIRNCDVYNCCDSLDGAGTPGGDGDGFLISAGGGETDTLRLAVLSGCRAWYVSDDGFDIGHSKQVQIDNCWSWANGASYYSKGYDGDGTGFKFSYSVIKADGKRWYKNCITAYNETYGCSETNLDYGPRMQYFNNVSYRDNLPFVSVYSGLECGVDPMHVVFRNNIAYAYKYPYPVNFGVCNYGYPSYITQDHNTWIQGSANLGIPNPQYSVSESDFVSLDTAQLRWPRKPDGSLPEITFMKLRLGSDLIDAGTDVGLPYYGSAPDLGYSEYVSGSVIIPDPVYLSSVIEHATPAKLEMTYTLTLANVVPPVSAFAVRVNSSTRNISSVTISGTKVILTLVSPVVHGDVVTVAYSKPSTNPLQTSAGGEASGLTAQNVINNCLEMPNQPPVITITSPAKSVTFTSPATIIIEATVSDPDGSIIKVEFYNGTTKLGETTSSPFTYTWKDVSEGTYSLTAVATDNLSAKAVSDVVTAVVVKSSPGVNQFPIVMITHPDRSKKYKKHDNVVIEAVANDPDGTIDKVVIKSGSTTLAELTTPPYNFTWEDVDTGKFIITAIATDNLGAVSISSELELIVADFYDANSEIINLYPNPNDGHFSMELASYVHSGENRIEIVNMAGKIVYIDNLSANDNTRNFDLSDISEGVYVMIITVGNSILGTKKFIIR